METFYLVCALTGGTVVVIQFLFTLVGIGHDGGDVGHDVAHDVHAGDHDANASMFFGMLSIRALSAAVAFFGIGGLAASSSSYSGPMALMMALSSGAVAMVLVAWMMRLLHSLGSEGTIRMDHILGATGTVYLTIPERKTGLGKVTVTVQNRTVEYDALTAKSALTQGASVVVVGVVSPDTLEVESASTMEGNEDAS
ncbi:MAG: hypothetical protein K1Y02_12600 [Candidatus Hydrogenedentes bacterium]|nr:hypothetical protein [Candidatus Hydrogenedentota bacterium]